MNLADSPGRMLCNGCHNDLGPTEFDEDTQTWRYECPDCVGLDGPLTLEVAAEGRGRHRLGSGSGVLNELGVNDSVREALGMRPGVFVEFAVLEHLFATVDEQAYRELVERYGHVAIKPDSNTASWMIGRAVWALKHAGEVVTRTMRRGTGRWDYLSPCHA
jgi:hypothetical protein